MEERAAGEWLIFESLLSEVAEDEVDPFPPPSDPRCFVSLVGEGVVGDMLALTSP